MTSLEQEAGKIKLKYEGEFNPWIILLSLSLVSYAGVSLTDGWKGFKNSMKQTMLQSFQHTKKENHKCRKWELFPSRFKKEQKETKEGEQ